MSKKQQKLVIRKTANLTSKMRKERGGEQFEETSTNRELSTERSDSVRPTKKKDQKPRTVKIQKEKLEVYDADLASMGERSCDTRSMDSILEVEDVEEFEKKCVESRTIGVQLIPTKYVTTHVDTPICAVFVSDFDICEAMNHPKTSQARRVEPMKRFEMEMRFLDEIGSDIEKLIVACGRMDVEIKVIKTRDENGMPRGRFSLIRRMKAEKVDENLLRQQGLYGFDVEEQELPDKKREFASIAKPTEIHSNIISGLFNSVKRRLGF